jgi:hypothetical protein
MAVHLILTDRRGYAGEEVPYGQHAHAEQSRLKTSVSTQPVQSHQNSILIHCICGIADGPLHGNIKKIGHFGVLLRRSARRRRMNVDGARLGQHLRVWCRSSTITITQRPVYAPESSTSYWRMHADRKYSQHDPPGSRYQALTSVYLGALFPTTLCSRFQFNQSWSAPIKSSTSFSSPLRAQWHQLSAE